ncbi:thioesterase family protein [Ferrovibrio sp.]|uniref:acyl-CoA thioesterase n=1 Tax=Ferrovibrio sp. TaxID=1917215 RepID=UPI001B6AB4ED|nr:thioesterase family protein [Ferrovibrio sp.]MBP7063122.1 acyl-CoA thioesterase [Ferrovibrio sp.]
MLTAEVTIKPQFHDFDPMQVVWHGNYARYLEEARAALLDRIGYNYPEMVASGLAWPIVDMQLKYIRPIRYGQRIRVTATLVEYEHRLRFDYRLRDEAGGEILTKARTTQLAVRISDGELMFASPQELLDKVRALL